MIASFFICFFTPKYWLQCFSSPGSGDHMYFLWRWWRTWLTVCCFGYWVVECVKLSFKERNSADWNLKPTILRYSLESRQRIKTALMLELHKCVKVLHCAELSGLVGELRSSWAGLSWWCTEVVVMVKTCFVVDLPCVGKMSVHTPVSSTFRLPAATATLR